MEKKHSENCTVVDPTCGLFVGNNEKEMMNFEIDCRSPFVNKLSVLTLIRHNMHTFH